MSKQLDSKNADSKPELYTVLPTDKKGVADVGSKICTKCNEVKSINNYSKYKYKPKKDGTQKTGIRSYCNKCKNQMTKDWFDKNKGYKKQWRKENPEKVKQENKKRQKKHKKWSQKSRDKLTDSYVIGQITKRSILTAEIVKKHPKLIEAKK